MKFLHLLFSTMIGLLMLNAQSAMAAYGSDDVDDDNSEKSQTHGTEVEIPEFVLLDAMPDIELYYYPYSADDADSANTEDVPGGAGSVFVGGGVIKWHANVDSTLAINDFTLEHIDTAVDERNTIALTSGKGIAIGPTPVEGVTAVTALTFDNSNGAAVADMSADMTYAYTWRNATTNATKNFDTDQGQTDFATKYYIAVTLENAGTVQHAGSYRATATVRALPTPSS